jgi:hypothetical protein
VELQVLYWPKDFFEEILRAHNHKILSENCESFNDCNVLDNCSPVATVTTTTTKEFATQTDTATTTSTILSTTLLSAEIGTVTATAFS